MNTTNEDWPVLECGQCKWFNVNADIDDITSTCKRLDHKKLRFAKKIFKCYDCGQREGHICSDFEPNASIIWLFQHWTGLKDQIIPYKGTDVIMLNVDKQTSVRWAVKATEFYNNAFINPDGSLRWIYKCYDERNRSTCTGYKMVYELPNGVKRYNRPDIATLYDKTR